MPEVCSLSCPLALRRALIVLLSSREEPRWIVEQEVKRRLDEYDANEREMQERLEAIRREKQKKVDDMKRRANFARKRPVSSRNAGH